MKKSFIFYLAGFTCPTRNEFQNFSTEDAKKVESDGACDTYDLNCICGKHHLIYIEK